MSGAKQTYFRTIIVVIVLVLLGNDNRKSCCNEPLVIIRSIDFNIDKYGVICMRSL